MYQASAVKYSTTNKHDNSTQDNSGWVGVIM